MSDEPKQAIEFDLSMPDSDLWLRALTEVLQEEGLDTPIKLINGPPSEPPASLSIVLPSDKPAS